MSYVSPPESRSRVENIKKRFEVTNNGLFTSVTNNMCFTKTPANRNVMGNKAQPNNAVKNSVSPRKKILHTATCNPIDIPKKFQNPSPSIKTPSSASIKGERQPSSPCGRGYIRRSPAFRCDKIVRGRNVTGQASGIREKTRSIVDNRVKLFEDGQNVKSVVKKLNMSPHAFDAVNVANKSFRPQLRKQLVLEKDDAVENIRTVMNSGNSVSTSHVTEIPLINNQSVSTKLGDNVILRYGSDVEKSETVPQHNIKLPKPGVEYAFASKVQHKVSPSFLHKNVSRGVKLTAKDEQLNSNCTLESSNTVKNIEHKEVVSHAKLTPVSDGNKVSSRKGIDSVRSEIGQVLQETFQEEANSSDVTLTDTLKAALKAPLPSGPPPKKPPRTFVHSTSQDNTGQHDASILSATAISAIEAGSNKDLPQHVKFTKCASGETNVEKIVKPVRSKTESQIMLKKLECVLLNHQQGTGGVVLRPKSPMVKRHNEDKSTMTYSEPDANTGKLVRRVGPLPSLPLDSELLESHEASADGDNIRFGGCLNFSCVSADSNNAMYSQIHLYEKVPEKQSEFFVESPKSFSPSESVPKAYGTLLRCRSRSEEHIYAEPFDYLNKTQNLRHNLQDRKSPETVTKIGKNVNLSASVEKLLTQISPSVHPNNITSRTATLHYLVSER
jgi:hypothetical protein